MMKQLLQKVLMLLVSLTIINVWLFRFNKSTPYRGGEATDMISEFATYGLSINVLYAVGTIKVLAAILMLVGFVYKKLIPLASFTLAAMMAAAVYFHVSVGDTLLKTFPAASMLLCSVIILFLTKSNRDAV